MEEVLKMLKCEDPLYPVNPEVRDKAKSKCKNWLPDKRIEYDAGVRLRGYIWILFISSKYSKYFRISKYLSLIIREPLLIDISAVW